MPDGPSAGAGRQVPAPSGPPGSSRVRLALDVDLAYEVRDDAGADFILNIHAARTPHQSVRTESLVFSRQLAAEVATDPVSAARFVRFHAPKGPLQVTYRATVDITHHRQDAGTLAEVPVRCLPLEVMPFIYPSRYCQSDRLQGMATERFGRLPRGHVRVAAIRDWVRQHVRFASNTSNSATSALDTLIDQAGVCRDFAHLVVALCRASNIPARVATGTDYGADPALGPPDFHAYVEAFLGDRWYIFDASGSAIPMGFLRLGTGRDAADVAFATIFGDVVAEPPRVGTQALEAPGYERPHHTADALSTSAGSASPGLDCLPFDARTQQAASNSAN
jgi:transglutaminase-like putative cysteine protease